MPVPPQAPPGLATRQSTIVPATGRRFADAAGTQPASPAKSGGGRNVIIITAVVVGLAVLGAGGWYGFTKYQEHKASTGNPAVQVPPPTPAATSQANLPAQTEVAEAAKLFRVQKGGKVGFIDPTGKIIIPITLPANTGNFSEGLAPVNRSPGVWEYIDGTGRPTIKLGSGYADAGSFSEGLAAVYTANDKWGYIDKRGREAIKPQFQMAFDFAGGYASVQKEGQKPGFIDTKGTAAFPDFVSTMPSFSEGLAFVSMKSDTRSVPSGGYIDQSGKLIIPCEYAFSANPCTEGIVMVVKDGARMGLSTNGEIVIKGNFQQLKPFSDGLAQAEVNDKWGYIDHRGKTVVEAKYENSARFSEGLAGVKLNGKWGFIDKTGKMVVEPRLVLSSSWEKSKIRIPQFHGGLALVPDGTKTGYIDRTGAWVWPPSE